LAGDVGWLALGVALTVAAGSQSALLTGTRRVGDLARISIGGGVLGTLLGVWAMWLWGGQAVVALVLTGPVLAFVLGHFYVVRMGRPAGTRAPWPAMAKEWSGMVRLGVAFMLSGLVTLLGQLMVRAMVQRELGPEASGQFQAAWAIGMTYLGFVLGAMGTDFYPRLTAVINDKEAATRLVNEQTEVALLLCAPVLLLMLGLAPWMIQLLYTAEFEPAVEVLRWQLLGDVLKVISWPLGFVILAAGAGKTFLIAETLAIGVFVAGVWLGLTWLGVKATGVAFLAMYVAYLPIVWGLAKRRIGFSWTPAVRKQALLVMVAALSVELAARWADWAGAGLGVLLAVLMRLSSMAGLGGKMAWLAGLGERLRAWTGVLI
jgi:O-antigen/teichoic acid export membrane protein